MLLVRLLFQTVFLALGQIWANKVRAGLTSLGIIIGVAAVISTVAATTGLKQYVLDQFDSFGAKKVFIDGRLPRSQWHTGRWSEVQLKESEVRAIGERCESITKITPIRFGSYDVRHGDRELKGIQCMGIWPEWNEIEQRAITFGRPFMRIDIDEHLNVCIVNDKAIEELQLDKDPTGTFIMIGGRRFLIVGVVETKQLGPMFGGGDNQTEVYIPLTTAADLNPRGWINYAIAELVSPDKSAEVQEEVKFILRKMRNLRPEEEDTYEVQVLQQIIDQFNGVASAITAGAGGIVAISLLVGGIGIMNIMLVSVSERTREIGLRKAVGARPAVILMQFLVEAVVLCLVGAAVGLLIGQLLTLGLKAIPGSPLEKATIPMWAVALAAGFSAATGIIFGMFPAIKASRLDPIVALRHE